MGKLHQIRKAFNSLTHEQKIDMYSPVARYGAFIHKTGYYWRYYKAPNSKWAFSTSCYSYRDFITPLVHAYHEQYVNRQKHVVERAYLNGEQWAIDKVVGDSS